MWVSSYFPESQSYYSTLAKLMIKRGSGFAELVSRVIGNHFVQFGGFGPIPPSYYHLAKSEFAAPTIIKLIPIPFSTSGASIGCNVNPIADQFQKAFQIVSFEALDKDAIEIFGPYGTSESSLFGTGSSLPPIPLHSIISYCTGSQLLKHRRMKSNDFNKSSRTDYYSESIRRARISRPYYHYAFAMLLGLTLFVTSSHNQSSFIWIVSITYNNKSSQE
ncbi:NADH:ubiquinone reductase (H(+)-translocating) [Bertholletia excelsa]